MNETAFATAPNPASETVAALILALQSPEASVRWVAAQALLKMGPRGILPLMQEVKREDASPLLREAARWLIRASIERLAPTNAGLRTAAS
jgi:HEAT repeat protein